MRFKQLKRRGTLVATLDVNEYRQIAGELRKRLPFHVKTEIERIRNEKGEKAINIYCSYPDVALRVLKEL